MQGFFSMFFCYSCIFRPRKQTSQCDIGVLVWASTAIVENTEKMAQIFRSFLNHARERAYSESERACIASISCLVWISPVSNLVPSSSIPLRWTTSSGKWNSLQIWEDIDAIFSPVFATLSSSSSFMTLPKLEHTIASRDEDDRNLRIVFCHVQSFLSMDFDRPSQRASIKDAILCELLQIFPPLADYDINDYCSIFFTQLGGDSLLATRAGTRILRSIDPSLQANETSLSESPGIVALRYFFFFF